MWHTLGDLLGRLYLSLRLREAKPLRDGLAFFESLATIKDVRILNAFNLLQRLGFLFREVFRLDNGCVVSFEFDTTEHIKRSLKKCKSPDDFFTLIASMDNMADTITPIIERWILKELLGEEYFYRCVSTADETPGKPVVFMEEAISSRRISVVIIELYRRNRAGKQLFLSYVPVSTFWHEYLKERQHSDTDDAPLLNPLLEDFYWQLIDYCQQLYDGQSPTLPETIKRHPLYRKISALTNSVDSYASFSNLVDGLDRLFRDKKICPVCGNDLIARRGQKVCSPRCRAKLHRLRKLIAKHEGTTSVSPERLMQVDALGGKYTSTWKGIYNYSETAAIL